MKLNVFDIDYVGWDDLVKSFDNYDVHQLQSYVKAYMNEGDGEPLLFYFESENNRGINIVMKRDINSDKQFDNDIGSNKYYDLRTPYGYGGWLFDNNSDIDVAYDMYINWCKSNSIVAEFTRFSLFNSIENYYGEIKNSFDNIVLNLDGTIDEIYNNFERRHKKDLKKTDDLSLIIENSNEHLNDFLDIYYETMNRNSAKEEFYYKKEFFETLNKTKENCMYFYTLIDGKIISTELVLVDGKNIYSFLGGTNKDFYSYHPNHYLKYQIIKWGVENGYKNFVLGGGYGGNDNIFFYKKGFAPNGIVKFKTGRAIFNNEIYDMLVKIRTKNGLNIENNDFFPLYRAQ